MSGDVSYVRGAASEASPCGPVAFADFAVAVYPFLEVRPFHDVYYRLLELFAAGRLRRLMVSMPPQHGTSMRTTVTL